MVSNVLATAIMTLAGLHDKEENAVSYLKEIGIPEITIEWIIAGDIEFFETVKVKEDTPKHVVKRLVSHFEEIDPNLKKKGLWFS